MAIVKTTIFILIFYIFHEFAHILTAYFLGYKINQMKFKWIGINIYYKEEFILPKHDILISLSGPMANFFFVFFFKVIIINNLFFRINLILVMYNLLPLNLTDGGRILRNIIKDYLAFYYAYISVGILSLVLSLIIIVFSLINYNGYNYIFFIFISLYVIFKTYQDYKMITINVLRDLYLKDILLKNKKVIKIKLRGLQSTNKILDIIKTFCFNKYYVIYVFKSSKLIGKINEREIALGLQQYGNITLEELLIKNNRRNTNDRIE